MAIQGGTHQKGFLVPDRIFLHNGKKRLAARLRVYLSERNEDSVQERSV